MGGGGEGIVDKCWSGKRGLEGGGPGRRSGRDSFSFSVIKTACIWGEKGLRERERVW